jgi:hypothetical protein
MPVRRAPRGGGSPGPVLPGPLSFLASEGAGFITGQRIVVDGGRSLGN